MRNSIKQISLYLLIASLTWLPVQVTFASSFVMPSNSAMLSDLSSVSTNSHQQLDKSSHCDTTQHEKDCCNNGGACSQMDHDCNHCVSFVAMAQATQQKFSATHYPIQTIYNQRLTGITRLSAYRPPC